MQQLDISNHAFWGHLDCFENLLEISNCMPIEKDLTINLSNLCEVNPFNMLVLALSIKKLKKWFNKITINLPSQQVDGYMQYMGFYETCGAIPREINKGSYKPGRYICIKEINFTYCGSIEADYEMIETEAKNPKLNLVELAIVDEGQGIKKAMELKYQQKDELEIIKYAMIPGITARSNHVFLPRGDYYQNSGYGLYLTKELALAYDGNFILCSGNYALRYCIEDHQAVCRCYKTKFNGTAIAIRFRTDRPQNFQELIATIKKRGETLSKKYDEAIHIASKSSGGSGRF